MKSFGVYVLIILMFAGAYAINLFEWFTSGNLTFVLLIIIVILLFAFHLAIKSQLQDKENGNDENN